MCKMDRSIPHTQVQNADASKADIQRYIHLPALVPTKVYSNLPPEQEEIISPKSQ